MAFRYKVSKTVQVKQFEPLVIEAEYSTDKVVSTANWDKVAAKVEAFVKDRIDRQVYEYRNSLNKKQKDFNVVDELPED